MLLLRKKYPQYKQDSTGWWRFLNHTTLSQEIWKLSSQPFAIKDQKCNNESWSIFTVGVIMTLNYMMDCLKMINFKLWKSLRCINSPSSVNIFYQFQLLPHTVNVTKYPHPFRKPHYKVEKNYNKQSHIFSLYLPFIMLLGYILIIGKPSMQTGQSRSSHGVTTNKAEVKAFSNNSGGHNTSFRYIGSTEQTKLVHCLQYTNQLKSSMIWALWGAQPASTSSHSSMSQLHIVSISARWSGLP